MRLERLINLPLNTVTPNFVALFVFFGTATSFIEKISFSEIEAKREAILFLFGCPEMNSTWLITSGLVNQRAPKALFTCVVYTKYKYVLLENPAPAQFLRECPCEQQKTDTRGGYLMSLQRNFSNCFADESTTDVQV